MSGALREVATVVEASPGGTVTEIRDALRADGRVSITVADVRVVLRGHPRRFVSDGGEPARWWLAGARPEPSTSFDSAPPTPTELDLYRWQVEALEAWRRRDGRGVVEAVTGTGKTRVGVAAITAELALGGQALVLVPTRELADQWCAVLARHGPSTARIGRLGGGQHGDLGDNDVVVAIVNSARDADLRPRRPGGLLVADECHRYGSDGNRVALHAHFPRRLGLSATYARADDGHLTWLDPYFTGTCYRIGYQRAIADGIIARFEVALHGIELTDHERAEYEGLTVAMSVARARLIQAGCPAEPIGAFFATAARLARRENASASTAARRYLAALQQRRRLLAETPAKTAALDALAPTILLSRRTIVFTQSIAAAEHAADRLRSHGLTAASIHSQLDPVARRDVLAGFGRGALAVVTAPQVLDEGVDVPAADLAVVLAASRSRRQMIQRMGRVLRRKDDGRTARLVIVHASRTVEDPMLGAHEGFLDEVLPVAAAVHHLRSS